MNKSIESVWKEGFLQNEALSAPKINNLYNKKSQLIVDKLKRMFSINLLAISIGATLLLLISFFTGIPYIGAFLFLLFSWLVIYGKKETNRMQEIDKSLNSYQYLKSFDNWLKNLLTSYTKIYRIFYPLFSITFFTGMWMVMGEQFMASFPEIYLVNNVPVYWALAAILLSVLSGIFAGPIYRWDMNMVYGNAFKKLEEIINDMEELRA